MLDSIHGQAKIIAREKVQIFAQKQSENGKEEKIRDKEAGGAQRQRAGQAVRNGEARREEAGAAVAGAAGRWRKRR